MFGAQICQVAFSLLTINKQIKIACRFQQSLRKTDFIITANKHIHSPNGRGKLDAKLLILFQLFSNSGVKLGHEHDEAFIDRDPHDVMETVN